MIDINLQTKVVEAIFYGHHGSPIKDFISEDELLKAVTLLFIEVYGVDYIPTLLEEGELEELGWPRYLKDNNSE
jgi:hypothetical protein